MTNEELYVRLLIVEGKLKTMERHWRGGERVGKILLRRDTKANWHKADPVLAPGEVCLILNEHDGTATHLMEGNGLQPASQLELITIPDHLRAKLT